MQRRAFGPSAWLIDEVDRPAAWARALRSMALAGIQDIVPAERTVLVVCDRSWADSIGSCLDDVIVDAVESAPSTAVTIEVVYEGADLDEVAHAAGLGVDDVIERHVAGVYTV